MRNVIQCLLPLIFLCACKTNHYTVVNKGVAGNSTRDLLARATQVASLEPDVVIILAGTNDMVNSKKLVAYDEFAANFRKLIDIFRDKGAAVILMSPPPVDTTYLFQRHDRMAFNEPPNARIDSASSLISSLASGDGVFFIDMNRIFKENNSPHPGASSLIMNAANSGKEDGIHPTKAGYEMMAGKILAFLRERELLKRNSVIVCFGDSITYGAYMEGAGTITGDTYPAFLARMLSHR